VFAGVFGQLKDGLLVDVKVCRGFPDCKSAVEGKWRFVEFGIWNSGFWILWCGIIPQSKTPSRQTRRGFLLIGELDSGESRIQNPELLN
jgi:hypothetical protein